VKNSYYTKLFIQRKCREHCAVRT